ncbi:MAG: sugar phosphate isomerase/epimerase [Clostridiales bacterium]|nr:sugar phosphate isomerase/epimerase [Clostridiales bacterium]
MKKAIHHWGLPREYDFDAKMRLVRELGYDGVELGIARRGELSPDMDRFELASVKAKADKMGVIIHSLTCTLNWEASATSDIPQIREKARSTLVRQIDIASQLKADCILALPGFVALDFTISSLCDQKSESAYNPSQERIRYDVAYKRAVDFFREIVPYAEDAGITVCVENIWNHFLLSPIEMRDFIDDIGSDYVQSYFDVANVMPYGYPEQWIAILDKRIKRVHLKDYLLESNSVSGFTQLLEGDVDFEAVANALHDIGYDAWVTAEVNAPENDRGETAKKAMTAINKIFGGV